MTKEEKNEMYIKNRDKQIKSRKSKIISLAVVPVAGLVLTLILGAVGSSRQSELESATVLDRMTISEFLGENPNGSAVYTGQIKAVDPAISLEEGGEYIEYRRTVEQVVKIYDEEKDKYDTQTTTVSNDSDSCSKIEISDVVVRHNSFHGLPTYGDTRSEGADSNQFKTDFSYVPARLEGTFYIKCKDGEVSSVQYFESSDISGESQRGFATARIIIWILIAGIEIFLVYDVIKTSKIIKNIGEKIS